MPPSYEHIFVLYPRGVRTGGPEALHQLVDMLRNLGQSAFLVPCSGVDRERVAEYSCYDAPEALRVIDAPENAVVAPETHAHELKRYQQASKFCWWLSIDNSPLFESETILKRIAPDHPRNILRIVKHSTFSTLRFALQLGSRNDWQHLAQSSYAWSFISSRIDTNPSLLSDYTQTTEFARASSQISYRGRTVAYNPAKGRELLEKVIAASPKDIEWRPIQGYSRGEVIDLLQETSLYLDLGHHPGKDRMPREAALAGAVTIVLRRGAGAYYHDVPIPWEHKISIGNNSVNHAVQCIGRVFENVPEAATKQQAYVQKILSERIQFEAEVRDVFLKGRRGKDYADYQGEISG